MVMIRCGTVIAGKYRLEEPLATSREVVLWTALHLSLDKHLAIKFVGPEVTRVDLARRRFEREARAAALLHGPHVVQVHDYGVHEDLPYLVMELLHGENLAARLARVGALSLGDTADIVVEIARVLRRTAEAGVVHRDLKPSNVFIVQGYEEEIVKVLDFGVARAVGLGLEETTLAGTLLGSPHYMSPEQAQDSRSVDHRSDLWSLAVIAYRALTAHLPFRGKDTPDILRTVCTCTPMPPSACDFRLGPEIDAFFARALARDPDHRFQSASELAAAFTDAVAAEPPKSTASGRQTLPAPSLGAAPSSRRPATSEAPPHSGAGSEDATVPESAAVRTMPTIPTIPPTSTPDLLPSSDRAGFDAATDTLLEQTRRSAPAPDLGVLGVTTPPPTAAVEESDSPRPVVVTPDPHQMLFPSLDAIDVPWRGAPAPSRTRVRLVSLIVALVAVACGARLFALLDGPDATPSAAAPSSPPAGAGELASAAPEASAAPPERPPTIDTASPSPIDTASPSPIERPARGPAPRANSPAPSRPATPIRTKQTHSVLGI
jgi:serine/threonine-protein kinase